jgi:hypothetical protein
MLFTERSALTISGYMLFRDFFALLIHRGGMFSRNLKNARTAEPELDKNSLASLGIVLPSSHNYMLKNDCRQPAMTQACMSVRARAGLSTQLGLSALKQPVRYSFAGVRAYATQRISLERFPFQTSRVQSYPPEQ